jgi:hypothetical protein
VEKFFTSININSELTVLNKNLENNSKAIYNFNQKIKEFIKEEVELEEKNEKNNQTKEKNKISKVGKFL